MTPPVTRPADAGTPPQDAGTPSDASVSNPPVVDAGHAAPSEAAQAVPNDPPQTIVMGRASLGAADHGGRNGVPFGYQSIGQLGDWIHFDVGAGILRDLNSGPFRFRVGGVLGYTRHNGGQNVSGSHIDTITAALRAEFDISRFTHLGPVSLFPRLGLEAALGYGGGTTTVDGGFQLRAQSGFAFIPRIDLTVIDVRLGNIALGLGAYVSSPTVFGSEHNSAFLDVGGMVTFYTPFETRTVIEQSCTADRRGEIVQRIHSLQAESAQLREENTTTASFLEGIHTQLLNQGVSDDDLRNNIRAGLVTHIENLQAGETPLPRAEIIAQLRRLYGSYLRSRSADPVTDVAERTRLAREQFPDDFDPSTAENRTAAAQAIFPDNFDPYAFRTIEEVAVPEPLPQDCEALEGLRTRLEDERADLREQRGLLEGLTRMGLVRLGVPSSAAPSLIRAITRLSEIHFITARPQGAPDRVTVRESDIAPINAAAEAWGSAHRDEVRPMAEVEALFHAIFPRTTRDPARVDPTHPAQYTPSLEVLQQIADTLRSPDMRGAHFYVVGHTDSRGDDAMNQRLSLRRAQAIRDALIFFGVDPAMVTPLGRGESQLVYHFDQPAGGRADPHRVGRAEVTMLNRDGIRGAALQDEIRGRQAVNRRIEMFICVPNTHDTTCNALDAEVRPATAPASGTTGTGNAGAPVQTVVSPVAAGRAGPTGGGGGTEHPPPPPNPHVDMEFTTDAGAEHR